MTQFFQLRATNFALGMVGDELGPWVHVVSLLKEFRLVVGFEVHEVHSSFDGPVDAAISNEIAGLPPSVG